MRYFRVDKSTLNYSQIGILITFCVTFLIANNLCWLNPSERRPTVSHPSILYGWEYDLDSGLELKSAIDYPKGLMDEGGLRMARPVKNAVISSFIDFINFLVPIDYSKKLILSYAFHHLMNFFVMVSAWLCLVYLSKSLSIDYQGVLFAYIVILFSKLKSLYTSHTLIFQPTITIFVAALVLRLIKLTEDQSEGSFLTYLSLYMFLCGIFILIKQDYAPFLALAMFCLYFSKWKTLIV